MSYDFFESSYTPQDGPPFFYVVTKDFRGLFRKKKKKKVS